MKEETIQVYEVKELRNLNVISVEVEDERMGSSYSFHWSLDKCFCIFTNNGKMDWHCKQIFKRQGF